MGSPASHVAGSPTIKLALFDAGAGSSSGGVVEDQIAATDVDGSMIDLIAGRGRMGEWRTNSR
jgi:hypothetical protein